MSTDLKIFQQIRVSLDQMTRFVVLGLAGSL
jgi:hypothetical protein